MTDKPYLPREVNAYGTDLGIFYYGELGLPEPLAEEYLQNQTAILVQVIHDKTVLARVTDKLGVLDAEQGLQRVRFEAREDF